RARTRTQCRKPKARYLRRPRTRKSCRHHSANGVLAIMATKLTSCLRLRRGNAASEKALRVDVERETNASWQFRRTEPGTQICLQIDATFGVHGDAHAALATDHGERRGRRPPHLHAIG